MQKSNEELLKLLEIKRTSSGIKGELRVVTEIQEVLFLLIQNMQRLIDSQCNVTLSYIKVVIIELKKVLKQINHQKDKYLKTSKGSIDITEELQVVVENFQGLCRYYFATIEQNSVSTNAQLHKGIQLMKDALARMSIYSMSYEVAISIEESYFKNVGSQSNMNDIEFEFVTEDDGRSIILWDFPYYIAFFSDKLLTKGKGQINIPCNVRKRKKHNK